MKTITVNQGSPEWSAFRAKHNTASEAPVMMGASKYQSRDNLLRQKATGIVPEVSSHQQAIFDKGHAAEAAARALLEEQTGEDFFPITAISDDGTLLASLDGITMDDSTLFEHKLWNEKLAISMHAGWLEPHYYWQLEQQLLVTGASRVIFVCSDGTRENWFQTEYCAVPGRAEQLVAGWRQFDIDKAEYVPVVVVAAPVAAPALSLPALFIHAKGEITTSNMVEYGIALDKRLAELRSILWVTDQDFADAKGAAKMLRANIESAKVAKSAMLAQTATVGDAAVLIDVWCEKMRLTALKLEKDSEREELGKKTAMILATKAAYTEHVSTLDLEIAPHRVSVLDPVFADAIKGKRNFVSMQDGLNTMLANAKIVANEAAASIRGNLAYFAEHAQSNASLFADKFDLMRKPLDFVKLVISTRILEHHANELAKEDATRARIRAEEVARLERENAAEAKHLAEIAAFDKMEADEIARRDLLNKMMIHEVPAAPIVPVPNVVPMRASQPAPAAQTPPSLKLGQISERLGFNLTGEFLKTLGFEPAAREKNAVLFHERDFPLMCMRLASHIQGVQLAYAA